MLNLLSYRDSTELQQLSPQIEARWAKHCLQSIVSGVSCSHLPSMLRWLGCCVQLLPLSIFSLRVILWNMLGQAEWLKVKELRSGENHFHLQLPNAIGEAPDEATGQIFVAWYHGGGHDQGRGAAMGGDKICPDSGLDCGQKSAGIFNQIPQWNAALQLIAAHIGGIMYEMCDVGSRHDQSSTQCEVPFRHRLTGLIQCRKY